MWFDCEYLVFVKTLKLISYQNQTMIEWRIRRLAKRSNNRSTILFLMVKLSFGQTIAIMSAQNSPTLFAQHFQALAKQLQHFSATYPYIVGRNMLCVFGHPVVMCCNMHVGY